MTHAGASSRTSLLKREGLALLFAWAVPSLPATGVTIFLNNFEAGLCTWSSVANPEVCDGIDNDCDTQIDEDGVCMVCGDGFIIPGVEQCDDNNVNGGDGCSPSCNIEHAYTCVGQPSVCVAICGDGLIAPAVEQCDDHNVSNGDGCSASCSFEHGFACVGEPSVCFATCGDGLIASGVENCDDNNTSGGDGCSSICFIEGGWLCIGEPSVCVPN